MKHPSLILPAAMLAALLLTTAGLRAQNGPFIPTDWPSIVDQNATVDYYIVDQNAAFNTPPGWSGTVSFAGIAAAGQFQGQHHVFQGTQGR